jgi:hypothetical protein
MLAEPNIYSCRWFEFFQVGIDEARTIQETEFVCRSAPLPEFRKLVDICCGMGRHARALSNCGYSVTGVERDADAVTKARGLGGGPNYLMTDIREYRPEASAFDAAILMGQSFGYFDSATNRDLLSRLAAGVRDGGRMILDLWNQEFFAAHQGEHELKMPNGTLRENKRVDGDRLSVHLGYPDGADEQFEWQLYTPAQMTELAESVGLRLLLSCADFDVTILPSSTNPRIQFVLEKCG